MPEETSLGRKKYPLAGRSILWPDETSSDRKEHSLTPGNSTRQNTGFPEAYTTDSAHVIIADVSENGSGSGFLWKGESGKKSLQEGVIMIAGLSYYQICWYFVIFSLLGWVLEVAYHAVALGKVVNRGFLNGPVCPVYGFGAVGIIMLGDMISEDGSTKSLSPWVIFVIGMIVATLVELIAGFILDKAFHARWWDYSDKPLNFHGYICLEFSIIWGLAIVFVIEIIYPKMDLVTVDRMDPQYGWWILLVIYLLYLADLIVTVAVLRGLDKKLEELDNIRKSMRVVSDRLSRTVANTTIHTAQNVQEAQIQAALGKAELKDNVAARKAEAQTAISLASADAKAAIDKRKSEAMQSVARVRQEAAALKEEYERKLRALPSYTIRRMSRAFPTMQLHRHAEMFAKVKEYISGTARKQGNGEESNSLQK